MRNLIMTAFVVFVYCLVTAVICGVASITPAPSTAPIVLYTEHDTNIGQFPHDSPDWGGAAAYAAWVRQEAVAVTQGGKLITIVNPKPIPIPE